MFGNYLPSVRPRGPVRPELVGLLALCYVVGLLAFVAVGPFVLSAVGEVPFGAALQRVVVAAAAAYVLGMVLLLR